MLVKTGHADELPKMVTSLIMLMRMKYNDDDYILIMESREYKNYS